MENIFFVARTKTEELSFCSAPLFHMRHPAKSLFDAPQFFNKVSPIDFFEGMCYTVSKRTCEERAP